ncbi:MAG TPA: ABC transporter permease [Chroococcales cyanobacterium]
MKKHLFTLAFGTVLLAVVVFIASLLFSMLAYTGFPRLCGLAVSPRVVSSIRLTLGTATLSTALVILFALPSSYALSRWDLPGKRLVIGLLDLPLVMPPIALGFALLVFFNSRWGFGWGKTFSFQVAGIVLAQFTVILAFTIRLMQSAFEGVPPRYGQVARTLGCDAFGAFWRVDLPLARKDLGTAAILAWTRAMGEFGATVTLAGAMIGKTDVLSVGIFLNLAEARIEDAIAITLILVLLSALSQGFIRALGGQR